MYDEHAANADLQDREKREKVNQTRVKLRDVISGAL
jgi:hypothetical protein